MKEALVSI